jgi:hypothetical protein
MNEICTRDELLTDEQTAGVLQVPTGTLANWRCARTEGPPFIKVGRLVRYRRSDLDGWLTAHTVNPSLTGVAS